MTDKIKLRMSYGDTYSEVELETGWWVEEFLELRGTNGIVDDMEQAQLIFEKIIIEIYDNKLSALLFAALFNEVLKKDIDERQDV